MKQNYLTLTFCLAAMACGSRAYAQNEGTVKMVVAMNDNASTKTFDLDNVRKLTFGNDEMFVWKNDKSEREVFQIDDVRHIRFEGLVDGIETMTTDIAHGTISPLCRDGILQIKGWSGESARLQIFNVSGMNMLSLSAWNGENIDVSAFARGTYILKINNQTVKFIK